MKRLGLILVSVALMLGMAQCKKNVEPIATTTSGTMNISLDVDDGSKVSVTPSTGVVNFQTGDKIYVASNGKYVGTLTHNGTNFTGTISGATSGSPLYFYFMGNKTPTETLTAGTTASITVSISDQTGEYPVISAAPSNENFSSSTYTYTATLLNYCALVKFNVTSNSDSEATVIKGMKNKVQFSFSTSGVGTPTYSMVGNGGIKLAAGSGERWAILLPQDAVAAVNGDVYPGAVVSPKLVQGTVPAITVNAYLNTGIDVTFTAGHAFSVAEDKQVYFACGNLQYQASTGTWRFAEHQYDVIGNAAGNTTSSGRETQTAWIDLFGWATSGWNNGYTAYQPYASSTNSSQYLSGNLNGIYANSDWGVYNAISNGGNVAGIWSTLLGAEWSYLLNTREMTNGKSRYVNNLTVAGLTESLVLFPDDYNGIQPSSGGTIDASTWTNTYESAGCVCLPPTGFRTGTSVSDLTHGSYWSASNVNTLYSIKLYWNGGINPNCGDSHHYGCAVRLVAAPR